MAATTTDPAIQCANSATTALPAGHYSHICTAAGLVFISGQLPIKPDGTALTGHSFEEQTQQVLSNVEGCLARAGLGKDSLVQVRVYVTDIKHWPRFNELYAAWIGSHRPARAVAGVAELHFELAVEVEAIALAGNESS
ncbi:MAG TPA: RidA family protein [Rhizobacter sp.]|nr:RidA family protein [Rhizobacter sp.]